MSGTKLSNLSMTDLEGELRRRERELSKLERRRAKLAEQLAEVDAEIRSLGGAALGKSRPRNVKNLADALVDTLTGVTMSVTEVAEAVQRDGYRTTSPNFRTIVNQTLLKDTRFKRVGRGLYTSKSGAKSGTKSPAGTRKKGRKKASARRGKKRTRAARSA